MSARADNLNNLQHGGAGALRRIKKNLELTGPAKDAEMQVREQLVTEGRPALVTQNAVRLQAATNLYWNALVDAGERGDFVKLDRYVARFGWLASVSLRAWAQVRQETRDNPDALDYERILQEQAND